MSANSEAGGESSAREAAAKAVREAFGALPFADKLTTLVKVELDMLGDVADCMVSAAESLADEVARAFDCCEPSEASPAGAGPQPQAH
jgi:hypothetical protein